MEESVDVAVDELVDVGMEDSADVAVEDSAVGQEGESYNRGGLSEDGETIVDDFVTVKVETTEDGFCDYDKAHCESTVTQNDRNDIDGSDEMLDTLVTEIDSKERLKLQHEIVDGSLSFAEFAQTGHLSNEKHDTDNSTYTCVLCKESVLGSNASKKHLEKHICQKGFDCLDCKSCFTPCCIQDDHTLVFHKIIGDSLLGKLYRYINVWQLLIVNAETHTLTKEDTICTKTEPSMDSPAKLPEFPKTGEDSKSGQNIAHSVQSSRIFSQGNPLHIEAVSEKGKTKTYTGGELRHVCVLCFKQFMSNECLQEHLKFMHDRLYNLACPNCCWPFRTEKQFKTHLKLCEQTGRELHVCTFCDKIFKKSFTIRTHMYGHTGIGAFACQHCKKKWKNKFLLDRHMDSHSSEKLYECVLCDKRFASVSGLRTHTNIHTAERTYPCTFCNKVYTENRFLKVHMRSHTGESNFVCTVCSKRFYTPSHLKVHMYSHTGERPHVCSICNESFVTRNSLMRHMYRHNGLKPYSCITCNKAFVLKHDLSEHVKIHAIRSHVCKLCNRGFTTGAYLNRHMKQHQFRTTGGSPHVCGICNESFMRRDTLLRHSYKHNGSSPHVCSICNESFMRQDSLQRHMYKHNGLKPYSCITCNKAFALKQDLGEHVKIHGIKSHACKLCNKGFITGAYLNRHMKQHQTNATSLQQPSMGMTKTDCCKEETVVETIKIE